MSSEYFSSAEIARIVSRLEGADREKEERICREEGINPNDVFDIMWKHDYEWSEHECWVKR